MRAHVWTRQQHALRRLEVTQVDGNEGRQQAGWHMVCL